MKRCCLLVFWFSINFPKVVVSDIAIVRQLWWEQSGTLQAVDSQRVKISNLSFLLIKLYISEVASGFNFVKKDKNRY